MVGCRYAVVIALEILQKFLQHIAQFISPKITEVSWHFYQKSYSIVMNSSTSSLDVYRRNDDSIDF